LAQHPPFVGFHYCQRGIRSRACQPDGGFSSTAVFRFNESQHPTNSYRFVWHPCIYGSLKPHGIGLRARARAARKCRAPGNFLLIPPRSRCLYPPAGLPRKLSLVWNYVSVMPC